MAKQYIVYASGKRSKPATKEHIREMHAAGKIRDEAMVHSVDRGKSMPVVAFLERSKAHREPAPPADLSNEETQTPPPIQPPEVVSVWQSSEADEAPPVAPHLHSKSTPLGGSRAVRTFFLFRGFNIPKTGVVETRDYLRRTVGWLELWLKWVHLLSVLDFIVWVGYGAYVFSEAMKVWQEPAPTIAKVVVSVAVPGAIFIALALGFICLRISEAFLRLAPACIRYWIETTEERRLSRRAGTVNAP